MNISYGNLRTIYIILPLGVLTATASLGCLDRSTGSTFKLKCMILPISTNKTDKHISSHENDIVPFKNYGLFQKIHKRIIIVRNFAAKDASILSEPLNTEELV